MNDILAFFLLFLGNDFHFNLIELELRTALTMNANNEKSIKDYKTDLVMTLNQDAPGFLCKF